MAQRMKRFDANAREALRALPRPSSSLVGAIRGELSAFDYRWKPRLAEIDLRGDVDQTIASFRYGGLLFHGYTDELSDRRRALDEQPEHVLHSKREAILGASALVPSGAIGVEYDEVIRLVGRIERQLSDGIKTRSITTPVTLPYLLSRGPSSPDELLRLALVERKRSPFVDLRDWRREVLSDFTRGVLRTKTRKELMRIRNEIERLQRSRPLLAVNRASFTIDPTVVADVLAKDAVGLLSRAKLDVEADVPSLRFRLGSVLPGRRFRRMLIRLTVAQQEYVGLDRAIQALWYQAPRKRTAR